MRSSWPLRLHIVFGTLSILIGTAFILGGWPRVSASAYSVIVALGGPYIWGAVFTILGMCTMVGGKYPEVLKWSLLAGFAAYLALSLSFLLSALVSPTANYTAMVVYGWVAVVQLMMHYNTWTQTEIFELPPTPIKQHGHDTMIVFYPVELPHER